MIPFLVDGTGQTYTSFCVSIRKRCNLLKLIDPCFKKEKRKRRKGEEALSTPFLRQRRRCRCVDLRRCPLSFQFGFLWSRDVCVFEEESLFFTL